MNHIATGEQGEQMAAEFLQKQGYRILERRFRSKLGEIDIIAKQKEVFIFIEVKTRRSTAFGMPSEAVNYRKQTKIINTALQYLAFTHNQSCPFQFDIIEVLLTAPWPSINHIPNAFGR